MAEKDNEYQKFFKSAMKKFGIESPEDFKSESEKKKFFDYVDKNWKSKTESNFINSDVNEAQAVSGGKVHKFITGKNLTIKGKKYPNIEFEVLKIDNTSQLVKLKVLAPNELFGHEFNVPFKTIRRGPFLKTNTNEKIGEKSKMNKLTENRLRKIVNRLVEEQLNEYFELDKLEDAIKLFQDKIKKQGRITNARDEEHLEKLIKIYKEMGGKNKNLWTKYI